MTAPTVEQLEATLRTFRYSVFRLETLQVYRGSGEDDAIAAFQAGHAAPPHDPEQDEWEAMIRGHVAAGRVMQRVHVVTEPLTEYVSFELTFAYSPNAAAGEDIRIIPVTDRWPDDVPHGDFWLFDSTTMFDARYTEDGTWLGVELVTDPARILAACRWRDAALHQAQPWAAYVRSRPALAARLPVGVDAA